MEKQTFKQWFDKHLIDFAEDIRNHGCEAGFPNITYTADCVTLYDQFEDEIFEALNCDAFDMGYECIDELTATFERKDMLNAIDTRKNLLVWYMAEREAHEREIDE